MQRAFFTFAFMLTSMGTTTIAHGAETPMWQPVGPWQLDEQPDQCTLFRNFGGSGAQVTLQIQPNLYSTTHDFKLASDTLLAKARSGVVEMVIDETAKPQKFYGMIEVTTDGSQRILRWTTAKTLSFADLLVDDQKIRIVAGASGIDAKMRWPGAQKAFVALRNCQDHIATAKGEDAAARRAYKREAEPLGNAGRWVTNNDYPAAAQRQRLEGKTGFRLQIDKEGMVTGCEIIQSSGFAMLDERTCPLVSARAKFTPALDASGAPVATTYSNRVFWQPTR
ncbi:energy transducer TonB [Sphingopyxis sp.]|jgi:TonB family protein|uniref:energy transducer TonB n=1 Tax=Sphingopyxis sp. TaxID=1908224 RepID=UPI003F6EF0C7